MQYQMLYRFVDARALANEIQLHAAFGGRDRSRREADESSLQ
jgi:hypothetical protein